jgi:hypothetical protein
VVPGPPHGWRGRGAGKKIPKLRFSIELSLSLNVDAGTLQQNPSGERFGGLLE